MINWSDPQQVYDYLNALWQKRQQPGYPPVNLGLQQPTMMQRMSESPPLYVTQTPAQEVMNRYFPQQSPGLPDPNNQMADTQKPYAGPMPQTPSASPQTVQTAPTQPSYSMPPYKLPRSQSLSTSTPPAKSQGVVPTSWYR